MRVVFEDDAGRSFDWITTRDRLRPEEEDGFAYGTPFAVEGRSAREVIAEFGDELGWSPAPGSKHRLRLQAVIHLAKDWADVVTFDWWAPPPDAHLGQYVAYRNEPR